LSKLSAILPALVCGLACPGLRAVDVADYDRLWSKAVLYRGADGDWLREVKLLGREQLDWYDFHDGQAKAEGFYDRRTRLGADLLFRDRCSFRLEVDWVARAGALHYNKLTDCYFKQEWGEGWALLVGKQSTRLTLDGATSSNVLLTVERSAIAWNIGVPEDSVPGLCLEHNVGPWAYRAGLFSAGASTPGFGDFNAAAFGVLSVGREFAAAGSTDHALLRLDYMLQGADPQNATGKPAAFTRDHAQVWSLNFQYAHGPWALGVDLAASEGRGAQSDLRGLQVMPSYAFDADWQVVFRYTLMDSALADGLRFTRYESSVNAGRGDHYEECYWGLNRYFYGHKLKWMFGLQHTSMQDVAANGGAYHGWGLSSGFRVWW